MRAVVRHEPTPRRDESSAALSDVWPSMQEIDALVGRAFDPADTDPSMASSRRRTGFWNEIPPRILLGGRILPYVFEQLIGSKAAGERTAPKEVET
jgi:hypothetical protein